MAELGPSPLADLRPDFARAQIEFQLSGHHVRQSWPTMDQCGQFPQYLAGFGQNSACISDTDRQETQTQIQTRRRRATETEIREETDKERCGETRRHIRACIGETWRPVCVSALGVPAHQARSAIATAAQKPPRNRAMALSSKSSSSSPCLLGLRLTSGKPWRGCGGQLHEASAPERFHIHLPGWPKLGRDRAQIRSNSGTNYYRFPKNVGRVWPIWGQRFGQHSLPKLSKVVPSLVAGPMLGQTWPMSGLNFDTNFGPNLGDSGPALVEVGPSV